MGHEPLRFARLAAAVARRVAPAPSRSATPAALLAALLRERLRLTHRGPEDLLWVSGQLRRAFGVSLT